MYINIYIYYSKQKDIIIRHMRSSMTTLCACVFIDTMDMMVKTSKVAAVNKMLLSVQ